MRGVIALVLRRMRGPLILLILTYAIAVLGFVLIPGEDAAGERWRMDFFHAFYFVSFMATTIGFGEVPYVFTDAQRLWTSISIYLTVIAWFYALGNIIALIQDPGFRQVVAHSRFRRSVRAISEPFYLVCGYGDTGSLLVRALAERGRRTTVIDIDPHRINELRIDDLPLFVPGLCGDANLTDNLLAAGLRHPCCAGVLAVTDDDRTNLQIAITSKLLTPALPVLCRAETRETAANMRSFGTDYVINPFVAFADNLLTSLRSPDLQRFENWLTAQPGTPLPEPASPPKGRWIICGFGRLGSAVQRYLGYAAVEVTVVGPRPPEDHLPYVRGTGTEAVTLREAGVAEAAVVFAATRSDADNLSIAMTARELNPDVFLIARQNNRWSDAIFRAARLDIVMTPSLIIATEIMAVLAAPLLREFLRRARHQRDEWAVELAKELRAINDGRTPDVWAVDIDDDSAPAVAAALTEGHRIDLAALLTDPRDRSQRQRCLTLMLVRNGEYLLRPAPEQELRLGDRLLLTGSERVRNRLSWVLRNRHALRYVLTGEQLPDGWVWRWLQRRRQQQETRHAPGQ